MMSEADKKAKWIGTARWIYWTITILVVVGCMMSAGVMFLMRVPFNVEGVTHLGYPVYLLTILGAAKLLGGIAILQGRYRTLKEWGYAGYTFNLLGASASHAFCGDPLGKVIVPLIILAFLMVSYKQWKTGWM